MSADAPSPPPLYAEGERVTVRTARAVDLAPYREAVLASRDRLALWNPVDPDDLAAHLKVQSSAHRTFLIHARAAHGAHGVVGRVNVTNVVRGRSRSATMGYDAYDPYAGRGLFAEGLRLVVGLALAAEPRGMGLHRVEANVRPGNVTSAGVLRSLGFRREGFSPDYLYLPDGSHHEEWRDHDRYAIGRDDWPAESYPPPERPRDVVLVNGIPGSGKTTVGQAVAEELGVPLLSKDLVKEAVGEALLSVDASGSPVWSGNTGWALGAGATDALWALLRHSPVGGVVESWFRPMDRDLVAGGLRSAGLDPGSVPEIWCHLPLDIARERYERRSTSGDRHAIHGPQVGLTHFWEQVADSARPLGLGPTLRVDTAGEVNRRDIVRVSLAVRAASSR